jgi:hypothetical protein
VTIHSGATVLAREHEEFCVRVRAVAPEALDSFLRAVRCWGLSRDHDGMPIRERKANREALRILTEVHRIMPITFEARQLSACEKAES